MRTAFLQTSRSWLRKLTVGRHPLPIFKLPLPTRPFSQDHVRARIASYFFDLATD